MHRTLLLLSLLAALTSCERDASPKPAPVVSPIATSAQGSGNQTPPPPPGAASAAPPAAPAAPKPVLSKGLKLPDEAKDVQNLEAEAANAISQNDAKTAIDRFNLILEIQPGQQKASLNKARLCVAVGRFDDAIQTADTALAKHPGDLYLLEAKAAAHIEKGDARPPSKPLSR